MSINVVQKGQPLFRDYPAVTDTATAKPLALANPLFSWHVTYFTHQRKKVVVFTHDQSALSVVLYNVNAQNRARMATSFWQRPASCCARPWNLTRLWLTILAAEATGESTVRRSPGI